MRFLAGVVVGILIGKPVLHQVDKHYGHLIMPKLTDLTQRLHDYVASKENNYR